MAHSSQCLLHKLYIFPRSPCCWYLLQIKTWKARRAGTAAMSRTGKLCQTSMDTSAFKQSCKDYTGSGREWRAPCCSVWSDPHLPTPLAMFSSTEARNCPSGAFTSFHPATSVSSASWALQQGFGVLFPVSPSTSLQPSKCQLLQNALPRHLIHLFYIV